MKNSKFDLFSNFADGKMSEEEFVAKNTAYNSEIEMLENAILNGKNKVNTLTLERILYFKDFRKLTSEIVNAFISKIIISKDNEFEIIFKFSDNLGKISEYLKGEKLA